MTTPQHISKLYKDLIHGGNYTGVSFKKVLEDISLEEAVAKVGSCNTIATLVYHIQYYCKAVMGVLEGGPLEAHDSLSFYHPPVTSEKDWEQLKNETWKEAARFGELVANLSEEKLYESFIKEAYGTYYRNIHGVIEHTHYHLGQISLLKKLLREQNR
ncbi:DinB family protein [Marinirhabdus gelatinilytica]|uniref:DinB family protein n=1 Tax=Marinirhabdus gelatinilytica TaxID=1703343 RepID=A0A370QJE3_9FLAO|nr:DinB family protein [Marinirhabdus gelatinilytica]RDK88466.1 DinB family protein [Marinirhabdus gelatinilytica]